MNPYRELGRQCIPCCMHCLTAKWVAWCPLFAYWICGVCGENWD